MSNRTNLGRTLVRLSRRLPAPPSLLAALFVASLASLLSSPAWAGRSRPTLEGVVNINSATADELQLLPGIGPSKAQKVLEYRSARAFRTIEELARVKGIGPKTVRKLRPHLTVRGATTARLVRAETPTAAASAATPPVPPASAP